MGFSARAIGKSREGIVINRVLQRFLNLRLVPNGRILNFDCFLRLTCHGTLALFTCSAILCNFVKMPHVNEKLEASSRAIFIVITIGSRFWRRLWQQFVRSRTGRISPDPICSWISSTQYTIDSKHKTTAIPVRLLFTPTAATRLRRVGLNTITFFRELLCFISSCWEYREKRVGICLFV